MLGPIERGGGAREGLFSSLQGGRSSADSTRTASSGSGTDEESERAQEPSPGFYVEELRAGCPDGVSELNKEDSLHESEFRRLFKPLSRAEFKALPPRMLANAKKHAGLSPSEKTLVESGQTMVVAPGGGGAVTMGRKLSQHRARLAAQHLLSQSPVLVVSASTLCIRACNCMMSWVWFDHHVTHGVQAVASATPQRALQQEQRAGVCMYSSPIRNKPPAEGQNSSYRSPIRAVPLLDFSNPSPEAPSGSPPRSRSLLPPPRSPLRTRSATPPWSKAKEAGGDSEPKPEPEPEANGPPCCSSLAVSNSRDLMLHALDVEMFLFYRAIPRNHAEPMVQHSLRCMSGAR